MHLSGGRCAAGCCRFVGFLSLALAVIPQDPHVKLMDGRGDISLRQMCNEPCFVSVTFWMMDRNGRPFNRQHPF